MKKHERSRRNRLRREHITVVPRGPMKKAIAGALVGNTMEWYDFGIYGYLTAVMAQVFVPNVPEKWRLLVVLAGFAVAFIARPVGGFIFGPLGDKIGRQKVLAIAMLMMASATAGIGMLPTAAQIGNWAFVLLILMRLIQGLSTGGEYAGATTFVAEFAPDARRGRVSSILDVGSYLGFALGAGTVVVCHLLLGDQGMLDWGWRIPFLIALPLGAIALWFRLQIEESPAFAQAQAMAEASAQENTGVGIAETVKINWREILIAMAVVAATNVVGYSLTSYMPTYLENNHGYTMLQAAGATIPVLVLLSLAIPFIGHLSDKIGRKPVYLAAVLLTLVGTYPAYLMMGSKVWIWVAMVILALEVLLFIGVSAPTLPALFPTTSRNGAMAISYNVAVSLFGGTAPMISELLVKLTGHKNAPAYYAMFFAAVCGVALLFMKESAGKPLPGSMPAVATEAEARELVATQDENPLIVHEELPFEEHNAALAADSAGATIALDADVRRDVENPTRP